MTFQARAGTKLEDLQATIEKLRALPSEPIGEWMRKQGKPPESWRLVLPAKMREGLEGPVFWPEYVTFTPLLDWPVFLPKVLSHLNLSDLQQKQPKDSIDKPKPYAFVSTECEVTHRVDCGECPDVSHGCPAGACLKLKNAARISAETEPYTAVRSV